MNRSQNINEIEKLLSKVFEQKKKLQGEHSWEGYDMRLSIFGKLMNNFHSTLLARIFLENDLSKLEWYQNIDEKMTLKDAQKLNGEFDMFIKLGLVQFSFSWIESSLRAFVKAIDPEACMRGTAEYKSIYAWLLKRLNLQYYENTFDLLRLVRNSIHNNGVYFHKSNKDETIICNGKQYDFKIGKSLDFVSWEFIFEILNETIEGIIEIINSTEILEIIEINDPSIKPENLEG